MSEQTANPKREAVIEVSNLAKSVQGRAIKAINGRNLKITKGEIYALIDASLSRPIVGNVGICYVTK